MWRVYFAYSIAEWKHFDTSDEFTSPAEYHFYSIRIQIVPLPF